MIKFYGYKRCGTSRKAEKFLSDNSVEYEFIDITQNPPTIDELKDALKLSKKEIKKLFNTSGVAYREGKYKDKIKSMSEDEIFEELSKNGKLIKRPVVIDDNRATIGFNEDEFNDTWL